MGVDGQVAWLLAAPWRHGASQVPTPHVVLPSAQWTPVFSEIEGRCVALACPVAGDPGSRADCGQTLRSWEPGAEAAYPCWHVGRSPARAVLMARCVPCGPQVCPSLPLVEDCGRAGFFLVGSFLSCRLPGEPSECPHQGSSRPWDGPPHGLRDALQVPRGFRSPVLHDSPMSLRGPRRHPASCTLSSTSRSFRPRTCQWQTK